MLKDSLPRLFAGLSWSAATASTNSDIQKRMAASATDDPHNQWRHTCCEYLYQPAAIAHWAAIEAKVQTLAGLHHELQQDLICFFMTHWQPIDVPTPNGAVCETTVEEEKVLSCSGCANAGMTWLAQCARQAMEEADIDSTLLEPATDPRKVAKAYEAVMAASPSSAKVAHLLRDLLVLTVCTNDGPWTNTSIQETMNELFDKPVSDSFMPKVLLAYNTMHRAAKSPQEFKRAVNTFANPLCEKTREDILAAYIALYEKEPHFQSNASRQRKNRPPKGTKSSSDPSHLPNNTQLALDLADLQASSAKDTGCVKPKAQKRVKKS